MAKILLVDDDSALSSELQKVLQNERYVVETVPDGKLALELLTDFAFDALIIDWQMPEMDGIELCRRLRAMKIKSPILMLTGKTEISDRVLGLDSGADDYLVKPFHVDELCARLRGMLRRAAGITETVIKAGAIELHLDSRRVLAGNQEVKLGPKEYNLLETLLRNQGRVLTQDNLLDLLWATDSEATGNTIRAIMYTLRKKLGTHSDVIETIHGVGYRIPQPQS